MTLANEADRPLREAFSESMEAFDGGHHCPSWGALWSSARGETDRAEEDEILMHVGKCAACAAAWRMARDLARDSADAPRVRAEEGRRDVPWVRLAAGRVSWDAARHDGLVTASGQRADLSPVLPLL